MRECSGMAQITAELCRYGFTLGQWHDEVVDDHGALYPWCRGQYGGLVCTVIRINDRFNVYGCEYGGLCRIGVQVPLILALDYVGGGVGGRVVVASQFDYAELVWRRR